MVPAKTEKRDLIKAKGGQNRTILVDQIGLNALREYQRKEYELQGEENDFKPTPPHFRSKYSRSKTKRNFMGIFDRQAGLNAYIHNWKVPDGQGIFPAAEAIFCSHTDVCQGEINQYAGKISSQTAFAGCGVSYLTFPISGQHSHMSRQHFFQTGAIFFKQFLIDCVLNNPIGRQLMTAF